MKYSLGILQRELEYIELQIKNIRNGILSKSVSLKDALSIKEDLLKSINLIS